MVSLCGSAVVIKANQIYVTNNQSVNIKKLISPTSATLSPSFTCSFNLSNLVPLIHLLI